jgi:hypothetical protein
MYRVVGADRREYGPVSRETILEWIGQGRANSQTIAKFADGPWKPLGTFDEFKTALGVTGVPPALGTSPIAGTTPSAQTAYTTSTPPLSTTASGPRETNVCSVIGLVVPLVCCCCPFIAPVIGIVFSLIGLSQIRANPNKYSTSDALPKIGLAVAIVILILHIVLRILDASIARYLPKMPMNF